MNKFKLEKDWIRNGLRCVVIMTPHGHRCGYVGVDQSHPLYEVDYNGKSDILSGKSDKINNEPISGKGIVNAFCWDGESITPSIYFNVHGGLTYAGGGIKSEYPVESDLWWFGYDCAHLGDAKDLSVVSQTVRDIEMKFDTGGEIRSLDYCITECDSLAAQLLEVLK